MLCDFVPRTAGAARFDTISGPTFGNQFVGRVANPDEAPEHFSLGSGVRPTPEVLLFHRRAGGAAGSRKDSQSRISLRLKAAFCRRDRFKALATSSKSRRTPCPAMTVSRFRSSRAPIAAAARTG